MKTYTVISKGIPWLVCEDGSISTPPKETTYTRTRNGKTQTLTSKSKGGKLAQCIGKHGYFEVASQHNGVRTKELVHRLIGMMFVHGYAEGLTINHINGIKTDNRPENLEWVSLARNSQHAWETGLVDLRGERQPGHKLTSKQVVYIRKLLRQGIPAHTLAVISNMSTSQIALIRDNKRWVDV